MTNYLRSEQLINAKHKLKKMKTVLIIYGSTTGNTAHTAETIGTFLKEKGCSIRLSNVSDVSVEILKDSYDLYLLGCSTWGEDEIELQEDFERFYEDLAGDLSLKGKQFAVFGCGDSSYTYFCGAVDVIEDRIRYLNGTLLGESLRIDGEPETEEIYEWTEDIINA